MAIRIDSSIPARWHGGPRSTGSIAAIVFHYTGNAGTSATARGNANYFASTAVKASAHYCVDTGEVVYECVPLDTTAWSVGDGSAGTMGKIVNNFNSVSIEMVSCTDATGRYDIPEATQEHAAELYRLLLKRLPNVRYTIRHYDVSRKRCPEPMVDEAAWAAFKKRLEEAGEVVEQSKLIVDGREVPVSRILKDGVNYVRVRDIAAALDLAVSSQGSIAVLTSKA